MANTRGRTHLSDETGVNRDVQLLPSVQVDTPYEVEVQVANITLTSAQVLALNATPISVVAAPGAGKAIVPIRAIAFKGAGTAYAGVATGEDLALRYTNGSGTVLMSFETTGFLDQTTAQVRVALSTESAEGTASTELTPTANAALVAHMTTGEIITGDSDIKLRVYYVVVPTTL